MERPLQIGSIGAGGYAVQLLSVIDQKFPRTRARLAAVMTSRISEETKKPYVAAHGTRLVQSVPELLETPGLDGVLVPTSIDTHLLYSSQLLQAGKHVFCEKPVTATVGDAKRMIQARDRSGRVALIGYQHVYLPSCRWAKELILQGRIGAPRRVTIQGFWPRPAEYYSRNSWAGKWRSAGGWTLDSVLGNAFAHYPNLALWLTGPDLKTSNRVTAFEAELYRAYPIQTFDTCAIRGSTATGPEFLFCFTHACAEERDPVLVVEGPQGAIRFTLPDLCEFLQNGQVMERRSHGQDLQRVWMFEEWFGRMEAGREHLGCEIENALETTRLISAVSQGASIHPLPTSHIKHWANPKGQDQWAMEGIEGVLERCVRNFKLPSELGGIAWAVRPEGMRMDGFEEFAGPKDG